jgi:dCTP deaminase
MGNLMREPWDKWIPGVLNKTQIKELCSAGLITGVGSLDDAMNHSAIDLSLSNECFRMTHGSVKPSGKDSYGWFIKNSRLGEMLQPSKDNTYTLRQKHTYVFKLREKLQKRLVKGNIYGQATAKSSVGRIDVLARLIVDGMDEYEYFDPEGLEKQSGDMYLEITPITFPVKVKPGIRLSQLRLFYGDPKEVAIEGAEVFKTILHGPGEEDGSLAVDLTNEKVRGFPVAAFCAMPPKDPNDVIPLWEQPKGKRPEPWRYWRFIKTDETLRLKIRQTRFYLLRSKERISVPEGIAIYCRANDETIGEMRIHYAGFVHPLFGKGRKDKQPGTPLIFEVRGHQVNVSLVDGEKMAKLTFYRMSKDCVDKGNPSRYQNQSLKLSSLFRPWPRRLKGNADGTVEPA